MKILSTFLYQMFSSSLIVALLTLIPFSLFLAIMGLELAVSFIQAYVFTILTCSYIKDAIELH
jgi:F-type H+-transporting ATPase subunit a